MRRRTSCTSSVACAIALSTCVGGCAQILGYDDLAPQTTTTNDASGVDTNDAAPLDTGLPDFGTDAIDTAPPIESARPPARPPGSAVPSGKGKTIWLIVKRFHLGLKTLAGAATSEAWKDYGYDIDHVCTGPTEAASNVGTCLKHPAAKPQVLIDGNACRDNVWGSQLMQLVATYDSVVEDDANAFIAQGFGSWILELEDLDDGTDDPYAPGALYKAADYFFYHGATPPKFDGTDVRQVTADSVLGDDVHRPITRFANGYVTGNVWVSGEGSNIVAAVPVSNVQANLQVVAGVITMKLADDHSTGSIGVMAGAMRSDAVVGFVAPVGEAMGLCPGTALFDALIGRIKQYVDVVAGAPNLQNTSVQCDSMSIGIGFDLVPIQPVTEVLIQYPPKSPCSDAGADVGDGGDGGDGGGGDSSDAGGVTEGGDGG